MNVVSSTGDVLHHHHHHPLNVSVGGTDEDEGDMDSIAHDEEGRTRRRPTRGQSRIEFERLAAFFHVPINEAAKGLGVCATVLKKVCRKHGIPRWPHRKIKKLDTMLAMLESAANKPGNPQHDDDVRKKIDAVMRDREVLMTEGKLVSEGKSDHRRKVEGRATRETRKRKKIDDEEEEAENEHDTSHDLIVTSYAHNGNNDQEVVQGQLLVPMGHMSTIASSVDMNSMGYPYGYAQYAGMGAYAMNGAGGMMASNYAYNPMYWSAMNNTISLPGVHSISSGVVSSNPGVMMHGLPPHAHANGVQVSTPISPLTPNLTPTLSSSNPLPVPLHAHKHAKLSHSDVLLDHTGHYASASSSYPPPRSHLMAQHNLAYSDFSVQQESTGVESSSHYRLFDVTAAHPTSASE